MASAYELTRDELTGLLAGEPKYRVDQIWQGIWEQDRFPEEITTISKALREKLTAELPLALEVANDVSTDEGTTRKWVYRLHDGYTIETVLMNYDDRVTVCISTQAGCAMGCSFCATGLDGLTRSLGPGEMVDQLMLVGRDFGSRVTNAVAMGQGEPFANYDAVLGALRFMNAADGPRIGARHLTVSTCGLVAGIRRFAREPEQYTLAVSLHSAVQATRDRLMPGVAGQPLPALRQALFEYVRDTGRRPSLEYALIAGINDTSAELAALVEFARGLLIHVNLIPVNPVAEAGLRRTATPRVGQFSRALERAGISATVRTERGADIDAACGQLRQRHSPPSV